MGGFVFQGLRIIDISPGKNADSSEPISADSDSVREMDMSVVKSRKAHTSYCVIRPLGSTGSSHFRKIISSSGVKVRDSGAMPPGTVGNQRSHWL